VRQIAFVYHEFRKSCGVGRALIEPLANLKREYNITLIGQEFDGDLENKYNLVSIPKLSNSFIDKIIFPIKASHYLKQHYFDLIHRQDSGFFNCDATTNQFLYLYWYHFVKEHCELFSSQFASSVLKTAKSKYIQLTEKFQYTDNHVRYVLSPSKMCHEQLQNYYGMPQDKIVAVTNGFNPAEFYPEGKVKEKLRKRYHLPQGVFIFLFSGSNYERKGLGVLLKAISILKAKEKDFRLLLVGFTEIGPLLPLIADLGVKDEIIFQGFSGQMSQIYHLADAFVLPAYYDPCPNSVYEAMASGLPVIISQNVGQSEWIVDGKTGLVIQNIFSVEELAGKLHLLMSNQRLREKVIVNASKKIGEFQWDKVSFRLIKLYNKLCPK